jgi:outer membrane immunogenic protein
MKKMLLTGTALLTIASGSAMAADLSRPSAAPAPVYTKAPMMAPFSWTGFYVGGDGGYGYATSSGTVASAGGGLASVPYSFNVNGPIAGGFVGGNYQMGQYVFGGEADWQWANLTGNSGAIPGFGGAATVSTTVKSYGSARGRLGFAVDHWLFFGTAGWAWGTWSTSYGPSGGAVSATNSANSAKGWTAGAGIEYAFTNNLLGRVEYRYTDLGSASFSSPTVIELGNKVTINDIRVGLAFKFGGMY